MRVTFKDDAVSEESLTSSVVAAATTSAEQKTPLTASFHFAPDSHDGRSVFTFALRLSPPAQPALRCCGDGVRSTVSIAT